MIGKQLLCGFGAVFDYQVFFNIEVGHNPQSLVLFASFSVLPHTKVHQANTSMINSSDFHLRQIKSASECAFQSHVRSKPLKSFYFHPIISNYLVYPLNSEQVPLLHSVVHITLLKGKLILNHWPYNCLLFYIICHQNKQTKAG